MTMTEVKKLNPWLKVALEFGPLLVFFAVFSKFKDHTVHIGATDYGGFVIATAVFVPLLVLATAVQWRLTGKLSAMQIATLVLVVVFGGLSVWLNDPTFFKMKPTLIYLLFAGALGVGLLRGKPWLELVMGEALPMRREGWMILTKRFTALFLALAVANEVIWRTMSEQAWVNFKTFGLTAILFLFVLSQNGVITRYGIEKDDDAPKV